MRLTKHSVSVIVICLIGLFCVVDYLLSSTPNSLFFNQETISILPLYINLLNHNKRHGNDNANQIKHISYTDMKSLQYANSRQVDQSDEILVKMIKEFWLFKPSTETYNLENTNNSDFSMGQSAIVDSLLNKKEFGFFVECGALDGETRSNSLFFERDRYWQGLLIEASVSNFEQLLKKNRKVYSVPVCLGLNTYPEVLHFNEARNRGRVINNRIAYQAQENFGLIHTDSMTQVQCFPLYSMLLALKQTHIDYFSLDVEGAELEVLKTIPWDKVDISVLTVEFLHNHEGKDAVRQYVEQKGYHLVREITAKKNWANDFVFIKKSLLV